MLKHDFPLDGNYNVFPNYYHFEDIRCRNIHDLDIQIGSMSKVAMSIESPYMIS